MSSYLNPKRYRQIGCRCIAGGIGVLLALTSGGCASPRYRMVALNPEVSTMLTEADTRMISLRPNPKGGSNPKILCAEPSPDVAKALSLAMQAETKVATPGGTSVGIGAGYASSEALMTLAGRTTTVVALRDGLYRACEAYANGIIGRSAYAMILSQYGDLLVTLMLGEAAAGATVPNDTTIQASNPTITIDSGLPPKADKKEEGATPDGGANGNGTATASTDASFVENRDSWTATRQPMLMPAAFLKEAAPVAPAPAAAATAKVETPSQKKAATENAAAVPRIAELYWTNIAARGRRSNFVTCVTAAESPSDGDPHLQMSLRKMCEQMFAALGATAMRHSLQAELHQDGRDGE